ncbi:MAG TPA: MYXO-CTERM sorting domain-containing protein, partial [Kofleriaceae bacterium]|nr:MYXO-CTERM sorting domain-containing protein [Kofleriaceae bacterium]
QLPDPGYADTLLQAMEEFAQMSGHPEVADAPVLCEGLSLGGYSSMEFAAAHPERTIAFLSGASGRVDAPRMPGFNQVPGLFYLGDEDPDLDNALERIDEVMALRAEGAQVAYFIQWGFGHERGHADELGWKFLADAVRLRYPEGASPAAGPVELIDIPDDYGWLADQTTWEDDLMRVFAYDDAAGSPEDVFWLPTRDAAYAYRGHATRDQAIAFTEPTDVVDWTVVDPGDPVDIAVSVGGLEVDTVEIFDGSRSIAVLDAAPYRTTWTAEGIGAHALVAVATLGDGTERSGYVAPVLVLGRAAPGGGGLDGGDRPDAGAGSGGESDGGPGGGTADDGDGGGCGCRTSGEGGAPVWLALLALAGAGRALRRTGRRGRQR